MIDTPLFFEVVYKPLTRWAARHALVGRNRSPHEPENGRFTETEVKRLLDQSWHHFDKLAPDVAQVPPAMSGVISGGSRLRRNDCICVSP